LFSEGTEELVFESGDLDLELLFFGFGFVFCVVVVVFVEVGGWFGYFVGLVVVGLGILRGGGCCGLVVAAHHPVWCVLVRTTGDDSCRGVVGIGGGWGGGGDRVEKMGELATGERLVVAYCRLNGT